VSELIPNRGDWFLVSDAEDPYYFQIGGFDHIQTALVRLELRWTLPDPSLSYRTLTVADMEAFDPKITTGGLDLDGLLVYLVNVEDLADLLSRSK
jgi:hypothetical protein